MDLQTMQRRIAYYLREWIHTTELSECGIWSDECPDWPLANKLADDIVVLICDEEVIDRDF